MSISIRLDDELVHDAEIEGASHKRTPPKQIEYWAEIGKSMAHLVSNSDLLALMQGYAQVKVVPPNSTSLDPDVVFSRLELQRENGTLPDKVTQAKIWYESSQNCPGLIDQVSFDGKRQSGHFKNGEFIAFHD
jgi:hypothetical protein